MSTSPRPSSQCRWSDAEVEARAVQIARHWAKATGRMVRIDHARRVGRLSMSTEYLLSVLTKASRPAIGSAWPALRSAELSFLQLEKAATQPPAAEPAA